MRIHKQSLLLKSIFVGAMAITATQAASAEGWIHNALAMGQFEGGLTTEDGAGLMYSCSPLSSSISLSADGMHIAAGKSTLEVDGEQVLETNTVYNSSWDKTEVSSRVEAEWGDVQKDKHNAIIKALASGSVATWKTPNGDSFVFDLSGSSKVRSCIMN